ncbi:DUF6478 family protein [Cognatiyoonia sp. IB215446]|uniref:DUF6478 family protein n=1 Tax=Cognatiyoonia sp. IB215446 TaxID=3097355 RepID=UPI002A122927|nr:DUF6478 family protein [Cognatiyoonia sp. IB215446]MDX8346579.1 DUF6478 family protein [Cognatiyoonia sp. IB215446]
MPLSPQGPIGQFLHRRMLKRWRLAARAAPDTDLGTLKNLRQQARQLQRPLQELLHTAEARMALPSVEATAPPRPTGTDWSWRPKAWQAAFAAPGTANAQNRTPLGNELTLFHDCPLAEIAIRQVRNTRKQDAAPFGVQIDMFHFQGSYLSLVVEIPTEACADLRRRHVIQLAAVIEREQPITIYARINVLNGPNTEQILLTLPDDTPETMVEFDLAYSQLNEKRAERMWVDLMFENPKMNQITLRDLTFCRHPRADI